MGTTSLNCWSRRFTTLIAFLAFLTVVKGTVRCITRTLCHDVSLALIVARYDHTCCYSGQSNGPVRLWRNGLSSSAYTFGRVQVFFNSQWGNICDDASFRLTEATVICHQLGYTGAISFSRASTDS